jgi:hypothetical protein
MASIKAPRFDLTRQGLVSHLRPVQEGMNALRGGSGRIRPSLYQEKFNLQHVGKQAMRERTRILILGFPLHIPDHQV